VFRLGVGWKLLSLVRKIKWPIVCTGPGKSLTFKTLKFPPLESSRKRPWSRKNRGKVLKIWCRPVILLRKMRWLRCRRVVFSSHSRNIAAVGISVNQQLTFRSSHLVNLFGCRQLRPWKSNQLPNAFYSHTWMRLSSSFFGVRASHP